MSPSPEEVPREFDENLANATPQAPRVEQGAAPSEQTEAQHEPHGNHAPQHESPPDEVLEDFEDTLAEAAPLSLRVEQMDAEVQRAQRELEDEDQLERLERRLNLKSRYSLVLLTMGTFYLQVLLSNAAMIWMIMFSNGEHFPSDTVLIAWLTKTFAEVVGAYAIILRHFFPKTDKYVNGEFGDSPLKNRRRAKARKKKSSK